MAMAHLVYPGATHTRMHHSLGAYHLMCLALRELKNKGADISPEEEVGACIAILLHDVGHGPYSHALENTLVEDVPHETLSRYIMQVLNSGSGGALDLALRIFNGEYEKRFLHQLVSSQLDVDRMDYLNRDSFYTGVHEGVISYDRIIKMLTVQQGELMVEEKGIHSIEKFIIARRLMYWQVYLHKTVLSAENMLVNILRRARRLSLEGEALFGTPALRFFMQQRVDRSSFAEQPGCLQQFCLLDDYDILSAIKVWAGHPDRVLSALCSGLINRNLFRVELSLEPFSEERVARLRTELSKTLQLPPEEMDYFVFTGVAANRTYDISNEEINIFFKTGQVRDISSVDNALINNTLAIPIKKFYICYPKIEDR
ncbi:HD domain-containing protein [Compostibacter hankyongensis]|uniref:HD domain-containing protein n=2 Tax=Compostibacter hankyongensis TaxID=1007089 RepID=A0ABP8FG84_9BACT